jgi:hypothetical protein
MALDVAQAVHDHAAARGYPRLRRCGRASELRENQAEQAVLHRLLDRAGPRRRSRELLELAQ